MTLKIYLFDTEGLSNEEIKALNFFKKAKSKFYVTFDYENRKIIARSYYNFGGLGFDSEFYMDKGRSFIKMPMISKYIKFHDITDENDFGKAEQGKHEFMSKETFKAIKNKWTDIIKENVEIEVDLRKTELKGIKGIKFNLQSKRWSIEKEQKFEFPEIKEENILQLL